MEIKQTLEAAGHQVYTPILEGTGVDYSKMNTQEQAQVKQKYIDLHLNKIKQSDAILVINKPIELNGQLNIL